MAEGEEDFERAKEAFRKASEATNIPTMRSFANAGLRFLDRAELLSAVVEVQPNTRRTSSLF